MNQSEGDINSILEKYNPQNKSCKLFGLKYPKETILYYATGLIIQNCQVLEKNFDIFKYIQNIYLNLGLSEKEIDKCRLVEERFQKEFEMDLKLLSYDITKGIFQKLIPILYPQFNLNFALKDLCQPNILNLIREKYF